jgi:hypothetical protein
MIKPEQIPNEVLKTYRDTWTREITLRSIWLDEDDASRKAFAAAINAWPEIEQLHEENEQLRKENEHLKRDSFRVGLGGMYFISGQSPNTDRYGFPDTITICPTYGSDVLRIYTKVEPDDKDK